MLEQLGAQVAVEKLSLKLGFHSKAAVTVALNTGSNTPSVIMCVMQCVKSLWSICAEPFLLLPPEELCY